MDKWGGSEWIRVLGDNLEALGPQVAINWHQSGSIPRSQASQCEEREDGQCSFSTTSHRTGPTSGCSHFEEKVLWTQKIKKFANFAPHFTHLALGINQPGKRSEKS